MLLKSLILSILLFSSAYAESIYYFQGKTCPPCRKLETVLKDPEIISVIKKYDTFVKLDITKYKNVSKYYDITSVPVILILQRREKYKKTDKGVLRINTVVEISRWPNKTGDMFDKKALLKFFDKSLPKKLDNEPEDDIIKELDYRQ